MAKPLPPAPPAPVDPVVDPLDTFSPEWAVELAHPSGARHTAIGLGDDGAPYIAFIGSPESAGSAVTPSMVWKEQEEWRQESLGRQFHVACTSVHTLSGGPGQSFFLQDGAALHFVERADASFDIYPLHGDNHDCPTAYRPALMTPDGMLHMATWKEGVIKYLTWDGNRSEVNVLVDEVRTVSPDPLIYGPYAMLTVDSTGAPHVIFGNARDEAAGATYATRTSEGWEYDEGLRAVVGGKIAVSPDAEPSVCFTEAGAVLDSVTARCLRRRDGQWQTIDLFTNSKDTNAQIIGIHEGSDGTLGVLYSDWTRSEARVIWAIWNGTAWEKETVLAADPPNAVGGISMEVDAAGIPHLAIGFGEGLYYLRPAQQ